MSKQSPIAVIGAGSWGTALSLHLARNGNAVALWGYSPKLIAQLIETRSNERYLPGIIFPDAIEISATLAECLRGVRDVLIVVPSVGFRAILQQIKATTDVAKLRFAWGTKGLDPELGLPLTHVMQQVIGEDAICAVLSGPSFAKEVAIGLPTAISLAGNNQAFIDDLTERLHSDHFRVYQNPDMLGVELCGVMKNVLAVAVGIADGMQYGANTRAAMITRGLTEMGRLCHHMGASAKTLMSLAGVGDTILTCTDNQSRNRRFGLAIGQGCSLSEAMHSIGQTVEGYSNAKQLYQLATLRKVDMPILAQVYRVLYENCSPKQAVTELLDRAPTVE